jgi:transposase
MRGCYWTVARRHALERALTQTRNAALFRRLLALLLVDQGRSVTEVAQWLRVGRSSLHRWMQQFAGRPHPLASLADHRGQGRPPNWSQELESLVTGALAQAPRELGYPANSWTVPLLQAFLAVYHPEQEVSAASLRRRIKAAGYVWKRFRYVLAPDPEEEKKTLAFAANTGLARAHRAPGRGRNGPPALAAGALGLGATRTRRRRAHLRA